MAEAKQAVKSFVEMEWIQRLEKLSSVTITETEVVSGTAGEEGDTRRVRITVQVEWTSPAQHIGDENTAEEKYIYDYARDSVMRDDTPALGLPSFGPATTSKK